MKAQAAMKKASAEKAATEKATAEAGAESAEEPPAKKAKVAGAEDSAAASVVAPGPAPAPAPAPALVAPDPEPTQCAVQPNDRIQVSHELAPAELCRAWSGQESRQWKHSAVHQN